MGPTFHLSLDYFVTHDNYFNACVSYEILVISMLISPLVIQAINYRNNQPIHWG